MMTNSRQLVLVLTVAVGSIVSCGKSEDSSGDKNKDADAGSKTISSEPIKGKIDGQDWLFVGGYAAPRIGSSDKSILSVKLLSVAPEKPCDPFSRSSKDGKYVSFDVNSTVGVTNYSSTDQKFVSIGAGANSSKTSVWASQGTVTIDEVTDTSISGKILSRFDDNNNVNGVFKVQRCPTSGFGS